MLLITLSQYRNTYFKKGSVPAKATIVSQLKTGALNGARLGKKWYVDIESLEISISDESEPDIFRYYNDKLEYDPDSDFLYDEKVVRAAARGKWSDILLHLTPQLSDAILNISNVTDCPVCGSAYTKIKNDTLSFDKDIDEYGIATCTGCVHYDGFELVQIINGLDGPIADWLGQEVLHHVGRSLGLKPTIAIEIIPYTEPVKNISTPQ